MASARKNVESYIRKQLAKQIRGGNAFIKVEKVIKMVEYKQIGMQFSGLPYTFWQQFVHLRLTQLDILDFSKNADYTPLNWPGDYWPKNPAPSSSEEWEETKERFFKEREEFLALILNENNELYVPFPSGDGQTLFREALLILEHNAYHIGQLAILARLINSKTENM